MDREEMLERIRSRRAPWEIIVAGGGATGAGIAVEAASRGYEVLLLEQHDFGKGTSSRSTKLVHGGVRYLEQGNISLVMEALVERGVLRENAPHLVKDLAFIVPNYEWWEAPFYGIGLRLYDLLAGRYGFGKSENLSREETLKRLPTIKTEGLRGGVIYYDGQFDDSRLLINLVRTAADHGATLLNYCRVTGLTKDGIGAVHGVTARDEETGEEFRLPARVVINATGAFSDRVRRMADPEVAPMIAASQGVHLVFDRSFLPGSSAIMVPHTRDGRVMFAVPWHGHTLVGTTDTAVEEVSLEPSPTESEIDFILETAVQYLHHAPRREDILSAFAGIRPLVKAAGGASTASLSRDHSIHIDRSGLLTVAGGKWTTYRRMAEDCVNQAAILGLLREAPSVTRHLRIHGYHPDAGIFGDLEVYGSDAALIQDQIRECPELGARLNPALTYCEAEVVWAVRSEMARSVEDVLARRTRMLPLDAKAAVASAPRVAEMMAAELGRSAGWQQDQVDAFVALAQRYRSVW
jgi:glycerol-3-phosphate dehydrogenase